MKKSKTSSFEYVKIKLGYFCDTMKFYNCHHITVPKMNFDRNAAWCTCMETEVQSLLFLEGSLNLHTVCDGCFSYY